MCFTPPAQSQRNAPRSVPVCARRLWAYAPERMRAAAKRRPRGQSDGWSPNTARNAELYNAGRIPPLGTRASSFRAHPHGPALASWMIIKHNMSHRPHAQAFGRSTSHHRMARSLVASRSSRVSMYIKGSCFCIMSLPRARDFAGRLFCGELGSRKCLRGAPHTSRSHDITCHTSSLPRSACRCRASSHRRVPGILPSV